MPRPFAAPLALMAALVALLVLPASSGAAEAAPAATASPLPTAAQIDAYLSSKASPMAGQGAAFVASGGRWQLDPRLLVAIAGAESAFGKITCAPYNAWGWGCPNGPYRFESWADGIDTVAEGLRTNYLSEGRTTVALINLKYAPIGAANDPTGLNNHWTTNVSRFLVEQGGDPNDVDMDGVAGTVPLGLLATGSAESYGFEDADGSTGSGDGDGTGDAASAPALEVAVGEPRALTVRVRNTGYAAWKPRDVRLRRIDSEHRVVGAPYGAIAGDGEVGPGSEARFVVQLAAAGTSEGQATTTWRLEGPAGLFGPEIQREIAFSTPAFVAADPHVEATPANGGIASSGGDVSGGEGDAWTILVRVRNAGSQVWVRDGDLGVHLGLESATGAPFAREGWINERVATRMLEREAAPGETATFAFRVRLGEGSALTMRPFRTSGWASGDAIVVEL